MNKPTSFLVRISAFASALAATAASAPAGAAMPLPLRGAPPETMAAAMVTMAAIALAVLLERRSQAAQERSRALEQQLEAERGAHADVEEALAGSHEVLCRLVRQQETVREAERARIARDLHDELGHRLLSLRVELALQQAALRGTSPGAHDKLTAAVASLDTAIRSVRAIVTGLRPIATGQSLRQAVERHLADFARLHGLDYRFDAGRSGEDDERRDQEQDAVLFRVLQESLSNVARHAQATMVCITLVESAGEAVVTIEDDGVGPAALDHLDVRGCGVDGMRERTEAFGGTLTVQQGRRGGTVVCARLPLARTPAQA
ncbi:sensor histidine kinase [Massilia sp. BSC265]|uniref:sensor histidine kinase n=1 Tax=Massilia sp. BSC265 TaxID=1549812 RepID=UPI001378D1C0|nr:sensor histidine kinase [Massilia sp. BSC265]